MFTMQAQVQSVRTFFPFLYGVCNGALLSLPFYISPFLKRKNFSIFHLLPPPLPLASPPRTLSGKHKVSILLLKTLSPSLNLHKKTSPIIGYNRAGEMTDFLYRTGVFVRTSLACSPSIPGSARTLTSRCQLTG